MRKKVLASLLLLVFFSLQYGKIASYWYCKWQADLQQLKDCGCETHLEDQFADAGLHDAPLSAVKSSFSEFTLLAELPVEAPDKAVSPVLTGYILQHFIDPHLATQLRPPIV